MELLIILREIKTKHDKCQVFYANKQNTRIDSSGKLQLFSRKLPVLATHKNHEIWLKNNVETFSRVACKKYRKLCHDTHVTRENGKYYIHILYKRNYVPRIANDTYLSIEE